MKKKLEKFMYMGLGALIALDSYIFGTHQSANVDAQLAPSDVEHSEICAGEFASTRKIRRRNRFYVYRQHT